MLDRTESQSSCALLHYKSQFTVCKNKSKSKAAML